MKGIESMRSCIYIGSRAIGGLLAAGSIATTGSAAAAEALLPQSAPHYRAGDSWTYLRSDPLSGKGRTFTQTVTSVHGDGSASLQTGSGNGRFELTSEANVVPNGADQHTCGIALHFPLRAGMRYDADCRAVGEGGMTITRQAQCEVEGVETIETKAGSFSAIKLRMKGVWSPLSGAGGGPMEETLWYAPAVKRIVREEFKGRSAGKGAPATITTELVRYAVKP